MTRNIQTQIDISHSPTSLKSKEYHHKELNLDTPPPKTSSPLQTLNHKTQLPHPTPHTILNTPKPTPPSHHPKPRTTTTKPPLNLNSAHNHGREHAHSSHTVSNTGGFGGHTQERGDVDQGKDVGLDTCTCIEAVEAGRTDFVGGCFCGLLK